MAITTLVGVPDHFGESWRVGLDGQVLEQVHREHGVGEAASDTAVMSWVTAAPRHLTHAATRRAHGAGDGVERGDRVARSRRQQGRGPEAIPQCAGTSGPWMSKIARSGELGEGAVRVGAAADQPVDGVAVGRGPHIHRVGRVGQHNPGERILE
jgi:hypothetical protein